MTTREDPKRQDGNPDETLPKETNRRRELEAEIVKDLELPATAEDVRGGCVRTSLAGGCGHSYGQ